MAAQAPKHLSNSSKSAWRTITGDYGLSEPHHLDLLRMALEAVDRCEQARDALAAHGSTYVDRFGQPRVRSEIIVERDSAIRAARLFRELSLDPDFADDVRVPRPAGG